MEIRRKCIPQDGNSYQIFNDQIIPNGKIMQISISHFQPHQSCPSHKHFDLHDVFIIEKGNIYITIDDQTFHLEPKDVCLVRPGHNHSLINQSDSLCEILILGIACSLE